MINQAFNALFAVIEILMLYGILLVGLLPITIIDHFCFKKEDAVVEDIYSDLSKPERFLTDVLVISEAAFTWPKWLFGFCARRFGGVF